MPGSDALTCVARTIRPHHATTPPLRTSPPSISNAATAGPALTMSRLGGGFTWRKQTPLYLEGHAAYTRYDPVFVANDGTEQWQVPLKWNACSSTGGIGWDLPLATHWVVRPIFNLTLGCVAGDLTAAK